MAIDVEYFLLEYKKKRNQDFNSELFSLEGITRMEELGSFEEIMQNIVLYQTNDYSYTKERRDAALRGETFLPPPMSDLQVFMHWLVSGSLGENTFTWGYTTDEITPGALGMFLYPNVPPELDNRIENFRHMEVVVFIGFTKQEIPMFLDGLRGVVADNDGSPRFYDLREALEHLEKGLEAGFSDFLILYEDYYIASSSEKKTSK